MANRLTKRWAPNDRGSRHAPASSPRTSAPGASSGIPAVTFDVWHTLLYLESTAEDTYNRRQTELGEAILEASPVVGAATRSPGEAFRSVFLGAIRAAELGRSVSPARQIAQAARLSGRRVDTASYVAQLEGLVASSPFRLAPGARTTLSRISDLGIAIGVIANTVGEPGRALQRILAREGIARFVASWCWSDELPWSKPAPQIFWRCLQGLGSSPTKAVHVGDGSADIRGARNAGCLGSVLYTGLPRYGSFYRSFVAREDPMRLRPEHVVRRLGEVPSLLERNLPLARR